MKRQISVGKQIGQWALIALFAFCLGGSVSAQDSTNADTSKMSTSQKLNGALGKVSNIKRIYNWIFAKLKQVRKEEDLTATDCLGDKLTATKALLFLTERSSVNLKEAAAKNDSEKLNFHYNEISQSEARVRDIEVEAKLCRGKGGFYDGKTKVIVTGESNISGNDPTSPPWTETVVIRKTDASRFF